MKMSKKAYSTDLRERVIKYIELGNKQINASKIFDVSTTTISRWWIIYHRENRVSCKPRGGSKSRINTTILEEFVKNNPDKTLAEIGIQFGIKASSVYRKLKALNFSYKKKPFPTWKQVKTNEKYTKNL